MSVKRSLTTGKNDHKKAAGLLLAFVHLLSSLTLSGCGLFYQYNTPAGGTEQEESLFMVKEVVDGDTMVLSNGDHIRLLGINTPEAGMYFYLESKEVLELMVLGRQVSLEKDITDKDMYGRKLRYVFQEDIFVNLEMIKRGFANIYTCPPDVRYADEFLAAERYSRKNGLGLWELSGLDTVKLEVFYDAPGKDHENINGEYVILENTGEAALDTDGWTVKDSGTNIYTFDPYEFFPGSRIILFSGKGKDGEGMFYWNSPTPVWNNDFDTLYLRDKAGLLIEIYNY